MANKLIQCKTCNKDIDSNAKKCPSCGAKNPKPFYKKIWFWVFIVIFIGAIGSTGNDDLSNSEIATENKAEISNEEKTENSIPVEETTVPTEYKSALKKAKIYSDTANMSKAGIYVQLTSEYGEQFSAEAAQYAIDNVEADWKENALKKAYTYQDSMAMSPSAIYDQLVSEYGEQFTAEEAQYAVDNLE